MKHEKHEQRALHTLYHVRGAEKRNKDSHHRKRSETEKHLAEGVTPASFDTASPDESQRYSDSRSKISPASSRPSLAALLNYGDSPENGVVYPSVSGDSSSSTNSSKMALQNALTSSSSSSLTPMNNASKPVPLADSRPIIVPNEAYINSGQESHTACLTHVYHEDLSREKTDPDYSYYYSGENALYNYHGHGSTNHRASSSASTSANAGTTTSASASGSSSSSSSRQPPPASLVLEPLRATKSKKGTSKSRKTCGGGSSSSNRQRHTPSSAGISSPAFSAPSTPFQNTPQLASFDGGNAFVDSDNEYEDGAGEEYDEDEEDEEEDNESLFESIERAEAGQGTSVAPLGRPRSETKRAPAVQRERNRVAATKCRARSKAAISKLEEDERIVSDRRNSLSAQKSALMNQVLELRMELLKHGHCYTDDNIQNYLKNAASMIGQSGGSNPIWGPDGSGNQWTGNERHQDNGNLPQ